jgi:hypothetical protein
MAAVTALLAARDGKQGRDDPQEIPTTWIDPRVMEYLQTTPSRLFLRHLGRLLLSFGVSLRARWRG